MSLWKKFREWDEHGPFIHKVVGDFAITKGGFIFDRRIFKAYLIGVFLCIIYIILTSNIGFHNVYISCPADGPRCQNLCYSTTPHIDNDRCKEFENIQYLNPGETIGIPPSPIFDGQIKILWGFIIIGFLLAFSINKIWWNYGRSLSTIFEVELHEK